MPFHFGVIVSRPKIFSVLIEKGANKKEISLKSLYGKFQYYKVWQITIKFQYVNIPQTVLGGMDQKFGNYLNKLEKKINGEVPRAEQGTSFTDLLIWSIISRKTEMARTIWEYTKAPICHALLACQLYLILTRECYWFDIARFRKLAHDSNLSTYGEVWLPL